MNLKITLENKKTKELLLERVLMKFEGEATNLFSLMAALEEVKSECNTEANRNRKSLREFNVSVTMG